MKDYIQLTKQEYLNRAQELAIVEYNLKIDK